MKFLELGAYSDGADKRECCSIRMMATQYILCGGQLYRRSYVGIHLHCLKKGESERVMEEVHQEICGPHINGRTLAKKILRKGYLWNTMVTNWVDYVKGCYGCQTHANLNHVLVGKSSFVSHTKQTVEATNLDLFHSWLITCIMWFSEFENKIAYLGAVKFKTKY